MTVGLWNMCGGMCVRGDKKKTRHTPQLCFCVCVCFETENKAGLCSQLRLV